MAQKLPEQYERMKDTHAEAKAFAMMNLLETMSDMLGVWGLPTGIIKGVPVGMRRAIRKKMRDVKGERTEPPKSWTRPKKWTEAPTTPDDIRAYVKTREVLPESSLLRGPLYHGGRYYPRPGKTFKDYEIRGGADFVGEPWGASVTLSPAVAKRFSKMSPQQEKAYSFFTKKMSEFERAGRRLEQMDPAYAQLADMYRSQVASKKDVAARMTHDVLMKRLKTLKPDLYRKMRAVRRGRSKVKRIPNYIARVLPIFGPQPERVVLRAWTKKGQRHMNEAFLEALMDTPQASWVWEGTGLRPDYRDALAKTKEAAIINRKMSENLRKRGWKAVLFSPGRYDEYELRVLDPGDLLMIDKRMFNPYVSAKSDPGIDRLELTHAIPTRTEFMSRTSKGPAFLRDIHQPVREMAREKIMGGWKPKAGGFIGKKAGLSTSLADQSSTIDKVLSNIDLDDVVLAPQVWHAKKQYDNGLINFDEYINKLMNIGTQQKYINESLGGAVK